MDENSLRNFESNSHAVEDDNGSVSFEKEASFEPPSQSHLPSLGGGFASTGLPSMPTRHEAAEQPTVPNSAGFSYPEPARQPTLDEIKEKNSIMARLHRLNSTKKYTFIEFDVSDSLDSLRQKNMIATHAAKARTTVDLMKRGTVFAAKGAEALCARFPNKYVELDGYSDHLFLQMAEFDELLYDVYDAHAPALQEVSPLMMYLSAIGSNMMMYSMSKKMMKMQEAMFHGGGQAHAPQRQIPHVPVGGFKNSRPRGVPPRRDPTRRRVPPPDAMSPPSSSSEEEEGDDYYIGKDEDDKSIDLSEIAGLKSYESKNTKKLNKPEKQLNRDSQSVATFTTIESEQIPEPINKKNGIPPLKRKSPRNQGKTETFDV